MLPEILAWRGFTSLNGVMVAISMDTGKILDVEPMSRYCRLCSKKARTLDDEAFKVWKVKHADECKCTQNYEGSAPAMEPEGAKRMFERSIQLHNLLFLR